MKFFRYPVKGFSLFTTAQIWGVGACDVFRNLGLFLASQLPSKGKLKFPSFPSSRESPDNDIEELSRYRAVLSPNFSIYLEMAPVMQLYNECCEQVRQLTNFTAGVSAWLFSYSYSFSSKMEKDVADCRA